MPTVGIGTFIRSRGPLLLVVLVLAVVVVVTQVVPFTPIDPVRGHPQTVQPVVLWVLGTYGSQTSALTGNRTTSGNSLLLNNLNATGAATATWTVSFPIAYDVGGRSVNVTVWLPAYAPPAVGPEPLLYSATNSSPITLTVVDHELVFQPETPTSVPWWPSTLYVAALNQSAQLPELYANFSGGFRYIPLSFTTDAVAPELHLSITVPAGSQVWFPNLFITVAPAATAAASSSAEQWVGWAVLPVAGLAVLGGVWFLRRVWVAALGWTLGAGMAVQVALAPVFLHTDLITLSVYPTLLYRFGIVNLEGIVYGPAYYASLVAAPAPFYAAGLTPTLNTLNLLFKLTPIAFDGLTFVLLYRLLEPKIGPRSAYRWSTFGWLLNPLVVYVASVHGLAESVVAFFVLLSVYEIEQHRLGSAAIALAAAAVTLFPAAFAIPPLAALKRASMRFVLLLFLTPLVAMGFVYAAVYRAWQPLVAYAQSVFSIGSGHEFPNYGPPIAAQSPWSLTGAEFGVYPDVFFTAAAVVIGFVVVRWRAGGVTPAQLAGAVGVVFLLFYATYADFSVQFLVWVLPLLVLLLTMPSVNERRALPFFFGVGSVAVLIDSMTQWSSRAAPLVAIVLISLLFVPVAAVAPSIGNVAGRWPKVALASISVLLALLVLVFSFGHFDSDLPSAVALGVALLGGAVLLRWNLARTAPTSEGGVGVLALTALSASASLSLLYFARSPGTSPLSPAGFALALALSVTILAQLVWRLAGWIEVKPAVTPATSR
jgi:hypothetical protein